VELTILNGQVNLTILFFGIDCHQGCLWRGSSANWLQIQALEVRAETVGALYRYTPLIDFAEIR
jgi:hypothetical protein